MLYPCNYRYWLNCWFQLSGRSQLLLSLLWWNPLQKQYNSLFWFMAREGTVYRAWWGRPSSRCVGWLVTLCLVRKQREESQCSICFLHSVLSGTPVHGMVLPMFRRAKPFWKWLYKHPNISCFQILPGWQLRWTTTEGMGIRIRQAIERNLIP